MNVLFHPEAEAEFVEAVAYYEGVETGMGLDFAQEIERSLSLVAAYPALWPKADGAIRRCLVRRFPYGLLYAEREDHVLILAVMHLHRHPDYWKTRIPGEC